jgi:hypothetical protein
MLESTSIMVRLEEFNFLGIPKSSRIIIEYMDKNGRNLELSFLYDTLVSLMPKTLLELDACEGLTDAQTRGRSQQLGAVREQETTKTGRIASSSKRWPPFSGSLPAFRTVR